jgi:transposase
MENGVLFMSKKEVNRLIVMKELKSKLITQEKASDKLGLSTRQIRRLLKSYRANGKGGLISKKRGKASNHKIDKDFESQVISLISSNYSDFGPTLATEKLFELHNIKISKETIRKLMIKSGLWQAKPRNRKRVFQLRERRSCSGELVQADCSPHDWFEGRRAKCTLVVFIDDATGELMKIKFYESETTQAYAETLQEYIHEFGTMRAIYTDKHSIFRVNRKEMYNEVKSTQFGRMLESLNIALITANTPQAKGRVERVNKTLQDRLIKELRLRNIDNIDEANKFLDEEYRDIFNDKFMVVPKESKDMHRSLVLDKAKEVKIFSIQSTRKVSKNLEVHYNNTVYQLDTKYPNTIKKQDVLICESLDKKSIKLFYRDEELKYKTYNRAAKILEPQSEKTVNHVVDQIIVKQESQLQEAAKL